ncbi:kynureninase [Atractiella rhizophila]|nr:kynureninase [Atractiella rhizophila]
MSPTTTFARQLSASGAPSLLDSRFSKWMDNMDDVFKKFRDEFAFPTRGRMGGVSTVDANQPCTYLCGNSLGLMPKQTPSLVQQELSVWADRAVLGHFDHPEDRPWKSIEQICLPQLAELVGAANVSEIAVMGTLTANLHFLLASFYKPNYETGRIKILFEGKAFPSDEYALHTHVNVIHGLDPEVALIPVYPRRGEFNLRTEDIMDILDAMGEEIALVMFSGVQFYTGQFFEMEKITKRAKSKGCIVGWDLAHAIGNVPLQLHKWDVDFAAWCTYKYLNSGPGAIAGIFVHSDHKDPLSRPRLGGWWGHNTATRFQMPRLYDPIPGAASFQMSNPSVLALIPLYSSLLLFQEAGETAAVALAAAVADGNTSSGPSRNGSANGPMRFLRERSEQLTGYLEALLKGSRFYLTPTDAELKFPGCSELSEDETEEELARQREETASIPPKFTIITPSQVSQRGCQLSLLFLPRNSGVMERVQQILSEWGIVGDERAPDVIRLAPVPLYNNFEDVRRAADGLAKALEMEERFRRGES